MKKTRKKSLKLLWQLVYIVGTFLIIYFLGFSDPNFVSIGQHLNEFNTNWLLLCGLCVLGFWLVQGVVLQYLTHTMHCKVSFWKNLKVTLIGEYYSAITPFSTGGQPMQMGYYKRYGVNFAKSTCILAVRFIGYVLSMCIFYVVTMIVRGQMIYESYNALFWLTTLGFVINFATVLFLLFILINRKLVLRIGMFVIRVLTKISFFKKKKDRMTEKFTKGVDEFATAGEFIRKQPSRSVIVLLLSVLSILSLYSITYCIYRGVGLQGAGYIDLFTMQIFLYLAVAFFPTPGAIGASEGGFYLFFALYFPENLLYFAMMIWRLFTYYSNLIVGAILIIWDEVYYMIRGKKRGKETLPPEAEGQG
ncbi:flippase-like domain-containing protein [Christensenellaceae bacterium NSJ-63]|uniref:Phosphatidylglycerol lysyltransferase n=1 Tax=Guopingia tenuis TaxID=2763656 RepID=A0A926DJJ9_9FIRM|nr:lysylphosphatidylglycerol synthase transmembrane domain-containing protein [Guopingia tenuis]MBC8538275.1 flippase-like domain-containing protein [Guopingia tenuis]